VQERRNDVLDEMVELEYITEAEAEAARSTSVESTLIPHRRFDEPAEQIRIAAVRTLLNDPAFDNVLGVTEQQRLVSIFGCPADDEECELRPGLKGGLRVVTTVDWAAQEMANELLRRWFPQPADGTKAPTGAITTVENRTGAIRVMAGGLDFGDDFDAGQRDYDLALEGQRQPGSAFKPFALIAYLEQGGSLNSYWNMTSPQELECGFPCGPAGEFVWRVRGGRLDGGLRSLEAATYFSTNTVYAQVALAVGGTGIANTAHRLGVESTLPEVPGLALGVGEVSPLDMAAAYSTVANYGTRYEPYLIERIEGENGDVLWAAAPQPEEVLDPVLAATVVDVLKKVVSVNGATGTAANIGRPQAGKTGTTQSFRDAWFVGFVPQYSTAVWAGYADELIAMQNITINGNFYDKVFGGSVPAPIWREFMSEYLADVPVEDFGPIPGDNRRYRSLPQTEVPDLTGLLEREAKNEVYSAHLNPAFEPVDSLEPEGTILSQTPEPGARMNHNGTVTIEISTGLPPTVPLPSLIGMTRTEANQIAAEIAAESNILLNLVPQFTVTEPESWNLIVATLPPAGTPVGVDDVITIVIGKAPDA
jgi:membrane peptidoglycan carboxypeptidase